MSKTVRLAVIGLAAMGVVLAMAALSPASHARAAGSITFSPGPGTGAPGSTLGPYTMTPFPTDGRGLASETVVPSPIGGALGFSSPMSHTKIGIGWATWSHGYTGDVYTTSGSNVTMIMPPNTGAFYFYAEPNVFSTFNITATADDGTTSGPIAVAGSAGARYFGFWAEPGRKLVSISVTVETSALGFAVGEFGIAHSEGSRNPNVSGAIGGVGFAVTDQARENRERANAAAAPAQPVSPPRTGTGSITPPSTGDAGLADRQETNWLAALALAVVLGTAVPALVTLRAHRR